jgi:flagellar hook protein FlgE
MSLYGMMRTGSSGMNAQASRLSTVADNIANTSTTGYKTASTEFSSLLLPAVSGNYNSGAVETDVRYAIDQQGALTYTSSSTDLAITGSGFFVVQDPSGQPFLTRAGSFVPNSDGELVNAAGYKLLGYPYTTDDPTPVVNGFNGLEPISVGQNSLQANVSTEATFSANLNSSAPVIDLDDDDDGTDDATTPATTANDGALPVKYTSKSSLKAYDSLGNEVLFDVYFTKTADNEWDVSVYNQADADPSSGGFPYTHLTDPTDPTSGTPDAPLQSATLVFDPATGKLDASSPTSLALADSDLQGANITNMTGGFTFDLSSMTQLNYAFSVQDASVDGNAPSEIKQVQISKDGTVSAQYTNGDLIPIYRVAMANVESPDNLNVISGNVYSPSTDSGVVVLGFAGSSGFGDIVSGALESSNVDLAEELTKMIESQRTYTANSKVFQTGSDLMDVLVNLKR